MVEGSDEEQVDPLERWERGAAGWSRRADAIQEFGMRVSVWMVEQLDLQPGQQVLELAAGPGDTGFLAAELVRPGGTLISSDGAHAMLGVALGRARDLGVTNVEFKRLQLEWIDLPTATVDAVLCRWGLMFALDPAAALQDARRVLRPGGRIALAVWDVPERNPWATIPTRALVELGHAEPPDPNAPGMFALADQARLQELLESAGFVDVVVEPVELSRSETGAASFLEETLDLSQPFADVRERLSAEQWKAVELKFASLAEPFTAPDGTLRFPATSLAAAASA
jgi:ubiquinone/menaquinone biosynthesis C-methylase UbiE